MLLAFVLTMVLVAEPSPPPTATPRPTPAVRATPTVFSETYGRKLPPDIPKQSGIAGPPAPTPTLDPGSLAGAASQIKLRRSAEDARITNANVGSQGGMGTPDLYLVGFLEKTPEVISTHRQVVGIIEELNREPTIWKTPDWVRRLSEANARFRAAIEQLRALVPLSTQRAAHDTLVEGFSEIARGVTIAIQAAEAKDEQALAPASEAVRRGNRLCTEAFQSLRGKGDQTAQSELANDSEFVYDAPTIIKTHCEAEWPNDYRMLEYCIEHQQEGLAGLRARSFSDQIRASVLLKIRSKCKSDWPTDYQMRDHCESQQVQAYERLNPRQ